MNFLLGFIFSLVIVLIAYKKNSLNISGMLTAIVVGTLLYGFGTYVAFWLLMIFFISSSIITKIGGSKKDREVGRNGIQVIANSFAALIFSISYYLFNNELYLVIASVAIAASNSDTWGSEIGKLSNGKVISITTLKEIKKGESGGISLIGSIGSLLGGILIGLFYTLFKISDSGFNISIIYQLIFISLGGFLGSIIDSFLGILIQEKYRESEGNIVLESVSDRGNFILISGIPYFNNDVVNFISTTLISSIFYFWIIVFNGGING